ncbi:MAG: AbrB/MazE/SpoVT family DNA-binding domain-containing protein [Candidatus Gastranaerophilaceae bacterium]|jgi:bifunctional DNA-binding transcriptional regulator/antitoxin component of YhaV-PrlF toxin-antitoxin module
MKLQKQLSRKVGNQEYSKYVVTIPPSEVEKLGWKAGQDLQFKVIDGRITIEKSKTKS